MCPNGINLQIPEMKTKDLFRILLREGDIYDYDATDEIKKELENRGAQLGDLINQVEIQFNGELKEEGTIDDAIAKLDEEMSEWDTWCFKNYLDEALAIQKAHVFWIVHFFDQVEYFTAFGIKPVDDLKNLLQRFLRFEEWEPPEDDKYSLEDWESFQTSDSHFYIDNLVRQ